MTPWRPGCEGPGCAVIALERTPKLSAFGVRTGNANERAACRRQARPRRVENFLVRIGAIFRSPVRDFISEDSATAVTPRIVRKLAGRHSTSTLFERERVSAVLFVTMDASAGTALNMPSRYWNDLPACQTLALKIGRTARSPGARTAEWSLRAASQAPRIAIDRVFPLRRPMAAQNSSTASPGSCGLPERLSKTALSSAVNASPTIAINSTRQPAHDGPARMLPNRSGSLSAARIVRSGFTRARPRAWHAAR